MTIGNAGLYIFARFPPKRPGMAHAEEESGEPESRTWLTLGTNILPTERIERHAHDALDAVEIIFHTQRLLDCRTGKRFRTISGCGLNRSPKLPTYTPALSTPSSMGALEGVSF